MSKFKVWPGYKLHEAYLLQGDENFISCDQVRALVDAARDVVSNTNIRFYTQGLSKALKPFGSKP